jgi:hypothetical protein
MTSLCWQSFLRPPHCASPPLLFLQDDLCINQVCSIAALHETPATFNLSIGHIEAQAIPTCTVVQSRPCSLVPLPSRKAASRRKAWSEAVSSCPPPTTTPTRTLQSFDQHPSQKPQHPAHLRRHRQLPHLTLLIRLLRSLSARVYSKPPRTYMAGRWTRMAPTRIMLSQEYVDRVSAISLHESSPLHRLDL